MGYLDYNFLPLENWINVLPELTARFFSSMDVSSCHLIFQYQRSIICFQNWHQITCSQQGRAYSRSWYRNVVWSSPCVIIPWFNISVSPFPLERDQREWKVSTSSAEKGFQGNCQWGHWGRLRHIKTYSGLLLSNF